MDGKFLGLRLYNLKGSPFPRSDKVWDIKSLKIINILQNKYKNLWGIKYNNLYKYNIRKLILYKIYEFEIIWTEKFRNKLFWIFDRNYLGEKNEFLNYIEFAAFGKFRWTGKFMFFSVNIFKHYKNYS